MELVSIIIKIKNVIIFKIKSCVMSWMKGFTLQIIIGVIIIIIIIKIENCY